MPPSVSASLQKIELAANASRLNSAGQSQAWCQDGATALWLLSFIVTTCLPEPRFSAHWPQRHNRPAR